MSYDKKVKKLKSDGRVTFRNSSRSLYTTMDFNKRIVIVDLDIIWETKRW